jgi:hypothetical protein
MHLKDYKTFTYFVFIAVILGITSWIVLSPAIVWAVPVIVLGLILIGLGINSIILVNHTYKKVEAISNALNNIEQKQDAIIKEQKEQQEQSGTKSSIVPTLQAFSQLYFDYVNKQQNRDEQQKNNSDI